MKIGVCVSHAQEDIRKAFQNVKELGLDNCQLLSWNPALWTDEQADLIKDALKETGVEITAFWCGWTGPQAWNFYDGQETLGLVPTAYRFHREMCIRDRFRSNYSPHSAESIHIKGHIINFAVIICYRSIYIIVKVCKPIYILPHLAVACVENVRAVFMDVYALNLFSINITANMSSSFQNKAAFSRRFSSLRKYCAEQPAADYNKIIHF